MRQCTISSKNLESLGPGFDLRRIRLAFAILIGRCCIAGLLPKAAIAPLSRNTEGPQVGHQSASRELSRPVCPGMASVESLAPNADLDPPVEHR
jgi:hypothetical protein